MIRVLHIIPEDGLGGVEVAARSMADHDRLTLDFNLLFVAGKPDHEVTARIINSPFGSSLNPLAHLRALLICLRWRPQILICSLWRSVPLLLIVKLMRPATKIVFFLNSDRSVHVFDRLFSRAGIAAADEVWCDSRATMDARLRARGKPSRIISFVLDPSLSNPDALKNPQPKFVVWARLAREKGIDRAIEFISILRAMGVHAEFEVWGPDGGHLKTLKNLVIARKLEDCVWFLGAADHAALPSIAANASFFLQPSRWEGMALSCVEAMQLGLVPIITPVGEMANYVQDNLNGVVLDPADLNQAANRVMALLGAPQEFSRLRHAAIRKWYNSPSYSEDVCAACHTLLNQISN